MLQSRTPFDAVVTAPVSRVGEMLLVAEYGAFEVAVHQACDGRHDNDGEDESEVEIIGDHPLDRHDHEHVHEVDAVAHHANVGQRSIARNRNGGPDRASHDNERHQYIERLGREAAFVMQRHGTQHQQERRGKAAQHTGVAQDLGRVEPFSSVQGKAAQHP